MKENEEGQWERNNLKFSMDGAQCPALMYGEKQEELSSLGVEVLLNTLADVVSKLADLHEEATGVPASKAREAVISRLEVDTKKVKIITE